MVTGAEKVKLMTKRADVIQKDVDVKTRSWLMSRSSNSLEPSSKLKNGGSLGDCTNHCRSSKYDKLV